MVMLNGFMQGYRDRGEQLNRRRRELAQAFNEFKSANPTATFDEYQSFIDQYAGDGLGSNYLRGGAPSDQVLKTLAGENEKRRAAEEQQRLLEGLQRRGQMDGQMRGLADTTLLEMEGDDFDGAYQSFVERLGGDQAVEQFGEDTLRGYIGPNRLNKLTAEQTREALNNPALSNFLDRADPNQIDSATVSDLLGIRNKAVIEPIVTQAQTEARRRNDERLQDRRDQIVNTMVNALEQGMDPDKVVRARFGNSVYLDSENMTPLMEEAQSQYQTNQQEMEAQRDQERRDLTSRVRDGLASNELLRSAIREGSEEDAKRIIREEARTRLNDQNFEVAFGPDGEGINGLYDQLLGAERERSEAQYSEYRQASQERIREVGQETLETSVAAAREANKERFGEVEASIAGQLARRFNWTPTVQGVFEQMIGSNQIDSDATPSEIANQIAGSEEFKSVAIPMQQYQDMVEQQAQGFSQSTMDQGLRTLTNELETTTNGELKELLDKAAQIEDPAARETELRILKQVIAAERETMNQRLNDFAQSRNIWLMPGGGGWDQRGYERIREQAESAFGAAQRRLERLESEIEAERAEAGAGQDSAPAASPQRSTAIPLTTGPGGSNPNAGEAPISRWWRETRDNMPGNRGNPLGDR